MKGLSKYTKILWDNNWKYVQDITEGDWIANASHKTKQVIGVNKYTGPCYHVACQYGYFTTGSNQHIPVIIDNNRVILTVQEIIDSYHNDFDYYSIKLDTPEGQKDFRIQEALDTTLYSFNFKFPELLTIDYCDHLFYISTDGILG